MGNLFSLGRQSPAIPDPSFDPYEEDQAPIMEAYRDTSTYKFGMIFRLQFTNTPFAIGYPSGGGVLTRLVTGVELEWLGLDKMREHLTTMTQPEEDEFSLKLRHLGAKWWEYRSEEFSFETEIKNHPEEPLDIETGWPSTGEGVWVMRTKQYDGGREAVRQCRTMDERSRMIEKLGGKFYADPEDCDDLTSDCRIVNGMLMPMFANASLYSQSSERKREFKKVPGYDRIRKRAELVQRELVSEQRGSAEQEQGPSRGWGCIVDTDDFV